MGLSHVAAWEPVSHRGRAKGVITDLSHVVAREPASRGGGAKGVAMNLSYVVAREPAFWAGEVLESSYKRWLDLQVGFVVVYWVPGVQGTSNDNQFAFILLYGSEFSYSHIGPYISLQMQYLIICTLAAVRSSMEFDVCWRLCSAQHSCDMLSSVAVLVN
jgi:hypothetical protein